MKNLLLLVLLSFIFISCNKIDEPEILGTYSNIPEGCVPGSDPMFGCGRFVTLSAGGVADVLLGGDMVLRTSYKLKGQKIKIQKGDQFEMEMIFKHLENGSLRYEEDNSIWEKQVPNP